MKPCPIALVLALAASIVLRAEDSSDGATADYAVHEWGTFTSFQGSDGELLRWKPLESSDLPSFVFRRDLPTRRLEVLCPNAGRFRLMDTKVSREWLQRMETPVLYFHSRDEREVEVQVRFPAGVLTEWFPQVTTFGPVRGVPDALPDSDSSHLRWSRVKVLSAESSRDPFLAVSLPLEPRPSHYYPARETSANLVEATRPFAPEPGLQRDRVLFYRGAGDFATPLRVVADADGAVRLSNSGAEAIGPLFLVRVEGSRVNHAKVERLAPGEVVPVDLPGPADRSTGSSGAGGEDLGRALSMSLREAGLHEDEAEAMVNTWRDSWLAERGVRVMYLLPRAWTDRTLPLELNPPPRKIVRVMVGRAEVLLPEVERTVAGYLELHEQGRTDDAVAGLQGLELGRFLEATIQRGSQLVSRRRGWAESPSDGGESGPEAIWKRAMEQLVRRLFCAVPGTDDGGLFAAR